MAEKKTLTGWQEEVGWERDGGEKCTIPHTPQTGLGNLNSRTPGCQAVSMYSLYKGSELSSELDSGVVSQTNKSWFGPLQES